MPITEHNNHLCNVVVDGGAEPIEYHCSEDADAMSIRIGHAVRDGQTMVSFFDKQNHRIYIRARKVIAVEAVYTNG